MEEHQSSYCSIIKSQSETSLELQIQFPDGAINDLRFLMTDYVDHLDHHLRVVFN